MTCDLRLPLILRSTSAQRLATTALLAIAALSTTILHAMPNSGGLPTSCLIEGGNVGDNVGLALAMGDFNADGFDDIALGNRVADGPGRTDNGQVVILYGGPIWPSKISLSDPVDANRPAPTIVWGDVSFDYLGWEVEAADFNGDGADDLVITAPIADPPMRPDAGILYVLRGGSDLPGKTLDMSDPIGSNGETRLWGDNLLDYLGWSLAHGDVNADGLDDLVVGAPGIDGPLGPDSGGGYVFYGQSDRWGFSAGTGSWWDLDDNGQVSGFGETRLVAETVFAKIGQSVACGDWDGDGHDDIALGAPFGPNDQGWPTGQVAIAFGTPEIMSQSVPIGGDPRLLNPRHPQKFTLILGRDPDDLLGQALESADFDNDGIADLFVGAPQADTNNGAESGESYVFWGQAEFDSRLLQLSAPNGSLGETRISGLSTFYQSGYALSTWDADSDGAPDFTFTSPAIESVGGSITGRSDTYLSSGSSRTGVSPQNTTVDSAAIRPFGSFLGPRGNDLMGFATASGGDLDGDGTEDFAVGMPGFDPVAVGSVSDAGAIVVAFGQETQSNTNPIVRWLTYDPATERRRIDAGPVVRMAVRPAFDTDARGWDGSAEVTLMTMQRLNYEPAGKFEPPAPVVLPSVWCASFDRAGWTAGDIEFKLTALDMSTWLLPQARMTVFEADKPSGPWRQLQTSLKLHRRCVIAYGATGSYFMIGSDLPKPSDNNEPSNTMTIRIRNTRCFMGTK